MTSAAFSASAPAPPCAGARANFMAETGGVALPPSGGLPVDDRLGGVSRRCLSCRVQRFHERHQRGGLRGAQALPVGGHVPSALDDLPDELVGVEPDGHCVERRTALPSTISERMAGVALLGLEEQGALALERGP